MKKKQQTYESPIVYSTQIPKRVADAYINYQKQLDKHDRGSQQSRVAFLAFAEQCENHNLTLANVVRDLSDD